MSNYLQTKYLNLLSSQLKQFKRKGNGTWNFRCPFCGDSKKSETKARGYVFTTNKGMIFKCHNCGHPTSVPNLIKTVSPILYEEYIEEKVMEDFTPQERIEFQENKVKVKEDVVEKKFSDLTNIKKLSPSHPCRVSVMKRRIPQNFYKNLFYVDKFYAWTNKLLPGKFSEKALRYDDGRLIIPLVSKDKKIFGYQGRMIKDTVDTNAQKYYTIILDENQMKVYGLDRVEMKKTFYVFEGPIDSMFIPNSVAICGGELHVLQHENAVYVFDNEPRHEQTCNKIEKTINLGHKVVIWPETLHQKDVNDMIMDGMNAQYVKNIIDTHTYQGLEAELNFAEWRKH